VTKSRIVRVTWSYRARVAWSYLDGEMAPERATKFGCGFDHGYCDEALLKRYERAEKRWRKLKDEVRAQTEASKEVEP
jgi:hypothetical protein